MIDHKKRVFNNIISLSLLEVLNYIMPLVTLPYLVRVLGPEKYGLVIFAQVFLQYFVILADYGFYLSAPRKISINRESIDKISVIFSSIMLIKLLFMVIYFFIMLALILFIPRFHAHLLLYIFSFGYILGDFVFPAWFFQGFEKMFYITILYFISRFCMIIMMFIFIRGQHDYLLVPIFNSLGMIIAGGASLVIITRKFKVKLTVPPIAVLMSEIKEGWHYSLSTFSTALYTYGSTFILGILTNASVVGYYSAAERLVRAVQRFLWAISQSIYPYITKIATESRERAFLILRKIALIVGGGFLIISLLLFLVARSIVSIILGPQYHPSIPVLMILSILPFLLTINNIFGIQTMLSFGFKHLYSRIMMITALTSIVLCFIFISLFHLWGAAIAVVMTECISMVLLFINIQKNDINFWRIPTMKI